MQLTLNTISLKACEQLPFATICKKPPEVSTLQKYNNYSITCNCLLLQKTINSANLSPQYDANSLFQLCHPQKKLDVYAPQAVSTYFETWKSFHINEMQAEGYLFYLFFTRAVIIENFNDKRNILFNFNQLKKRP
jgi:hypothetical protein